MILLDTNVLSEMMKPSPAPAVAAWMAGTDSGVLFTTVVNEAEIRLGIELLPDGGRKSELQEAAERIIALFDARILSFDSMATPYFAQIVAGRRRMGLPIGDLDAQIAAVARSHDMVLATAMYSTSTVRESPSSVRGVLEDIASGFFAPLT